MDDRDFIETLGGVIICSTSHEKRITQVEEETDILFKKNAEAMERLATTNERLAITNENLEKILNKRPNQILMSVGISAISLVAGVVIMKILEMAF